MNENLNDVRDLKNIPIEIDSIRKIEHDGKTYWFGEDLVKFFHIEGTNSLLNKLSSYDYDMVYINKTDK